MYSESAILQRISNFFASDKWWGPVLSFMYDNFDKFKSKSHTIEQYNFFTEFISKMTHIVDYELCKEVKIYSKSFDKTILNASRKNNPQAKAIIHLLEKATDFVEFKKQINTIGNQIESDCAKLISQFQSTYNDPNIERTKAEIFITQLLEKRIEESKKVMMENCIAATRDKLYLNEIVINSPKKEVVYHKISEPELPRELNTRDFYRGTDKYKRICPPETTPQTARRHKIDPSNLPPKEPQSARVDTKTIDERRKFYEKQRDLIKRGYVETVQHRPSLPPLRMRRPNYGAQNTHNF